MKPERDVFLYTEKMEWEEVAPGLRRQIMGYDNQIMMVKVAFEKGAIAAMHSHYHTQITYVVSGKFELTSDGKTSIVSGGDAFYLEPNSYHGAVCLEEGMLIDVFSPMREEFV